jgi:hypothetical protein
MVAFFVVFAIATLNGGLGGLWERIAIGLGLIWIALFALRLLSLTRSSSSVHKLL